MEEGGREGGMKECRSGGKEGGDERMKGRRERGKGAMWRRLIKMGICDSKPN